LGERCSARQTHIRKPTRLISRQRQALTHALELCNIGEGEPVLQDIDPIFGNVETKNMPPDVRWD
ncbi:MAG: hypothetical protein RRY53_07685, partial [Pseudoflavonifractor sp.]